MIKPLDGIKVVELATQVAAPTAAKLLGDMGADVIKVESLTGDPRRGASIFKFDFAPGENSHFEMQNSGKKSVCLNLKSAEGMEAMHKLLASADVFITNVRLLALERLGLDHSTIRAKYPKLVYGIITSYGEKGPEAHNPGFDNSAFWARSGALADSVYAEAGIPAMPQSSSGDSVAALVLYSDILAALLNRAKTGNGDFCEASLFSTGTWMYATEIVDSMENNHPYPRSRQIRHPMLSTYKCKDGEFVTFASKKIDYENKVLLETLGLEKHAEKMLFRGYDKRDTRDVLADIDKAFLEKTADEWCELFQKKDVVCVKCNHYRDIPTDETAIANGLIQNFTYPSGYKIPFVKSPVNLESIGRQEYKLGPKLGENTDSVLEGLGYEKADIEKMKASGAVK